MDKPHAIRMDERRAHDAYAAHQAMVRTELRTPSLRENSQWQTLRREAYERFAKAFEVLIV